MASPDGSTEPTGGGDISGQGDATEDEFGPALGATKVAVADEVVAGGAKAAVGVAVGRLVNAGEWVGAGDAQLTDTTTAAAKTSVDRLIGAFTL